MAKPELGTKRVCLECSAKYFDLNRDPIVCPKCGTIFEIATRDKTRPAEAKPEKETAEATAPEADAVVEKTADEDTDVADESDGVAEIISLEDAEDADEDDDDDDDDAIAVLPDDNLVIDDDEDDDVFVKDDDGDDDDVSDIVAGGDDDDDA